MRGYQRNAGGRKATESVTENKPLLESPTDRVKCPLDELGLIQGNLESGKPYPKQDKRNETVLCSVSLADRLRILATKFLDE